MSNAVYYLCCDSCGYEDFEILAAYVGRTASDDWYNCPQCSSDTSNVIVDDPELTKEDREQ